MIHCVCVVPLREALNSTFLEPPRCVVVKL